MKLFYVFLLLALASKSLALPISNGNFSSGSSGWNDVSSGGSAQVGSGDVLELTGGLGSEPYSASFWQGDNGFFQFSNPLSLSPGDQFLSFDVVLSSRAADASESGSSIFDDFLSIEFYDASNLSYDLFFESGSDFSIAQSWSTVYLDITSLQGREFALTVNLFDEDDGFNTLFALDNFAFTSSNEPEDPVAVPEPSSLGLFLLGFGALIVLRKRKQA